MLQSILNVKGLVLKLLFQWSSEAIEISNFFSLEFVNSLEQFSQVYHILYFLLGLLTPCILFMYLIAFYFLVVALNLTTTYISCLSGKKMKSVK